MPLDPRIPLGVQPPQTQSPFEALSQLAQLQGIREQTEARRLAAEEARTKHLRQQQIDQAYEQAVRVNPESGDLDIDYQVLTQHLPGSLIPETVRQLNNDKKTALDIQSATMTLAKARREHLVSAAETVAASNYDPMLWGVQLRGARNLGALDEETFNRLSAISDPAQIKTIVDGLRVPAAPKLEKVTTVNEKGETVERFVRPQEGTDYVQPPKPKTEHALQAKDVLLDGRPALVTFNPTTGQYLASGQDVTARVRPIPPQGPQPSYQWAVKPGSKTPELLTADEIRRSGATAPSTGSVRPPTEGERKAAGFHSQMDQALTTINTLEKDLTERDLYQIQSLPQEGLMGAVNRGLMSETAKRYIQAFNQFTEARLRPVSGAAIANSEYERDRATYAKQYGETTGVADQRKEARRRALDSLRVMAGSALEEGPDEAKSRKDTPTPPGGGMSYAEYQRSKGAPR